MPLQRRIPKRGFTNIFMKTYSIVNVRDLAQFAEGSEVGPDLLMRAGIVKKIRSGIKLLAEGEIGKALVVRVHEVSAAARTKIEAQGGRVELI